MKISIRSRILILIGTIIYGDPEAWGLPCTKDEFYAMPNERSIINQAHKFPVTLHTRNVTEWQSSYRNVLVDRVRQRVFKNMAICSFIGAFIIFVVGMTSLSITKKGVEFAKNAKANISQKFEKSDAKDKRLAELKLEAEQLKALAKSGGITKEDFEKKAKEIDDENNQLKDSK